jgi:alkyl sulfatase BDS1-like metallo-beta-lactamase superfamily hydrolase
MLNAEYLIPSHSRPISGTENVSKALTDYRDGIQFVHDQTIRYINKGLTPDEIVEKVKLPEHLANSPYLQEFYGSISSYIRSTFSGYIGWFSGNISDLHPLTNEQRAIKLSEMAQKQTKILDEALNAFSAGEYQWSMELADMLLAINKDDDKAKEIKSSAADKLSNYQSASNDYYFYKTVAAELRDEFIISADNNKATPDQLRATPMDAIMKSLPVNLNPEKAIDIIQTVSFSFSDDQETFTIKIRKGVAELSLLPAEKNDLKIYSDQQTIKETLAGLRNIASISLSLANDTIQVEGGNIEFLKFLGLFTD